MSWLLVSLKDAVKEAAALNLIDIPLALAGAYYYGTSPLAAFGIILLAEAVFLMLTGGAMDLANSASAHGLETMILRRERKEAAAPAAAAASRVVPRLHRATVFSAAGLILFGETVVLALPYILA